MRRTLIFGLLSALALGQGRQTSAKLREKGTAGPGYIQETFVDDLTARMNERLGERAAAQMLDRLRGSDIDADDVLKLMNGEGFTKSALRKQFGASSGQVERLKEALDGAVLDKERKLFFGILVTTMAAADVDPSSDFCKLVGGSCDEIDEEHFLAIKRGRVDTSLLKDCFKIKDKQDLKSMQRYVNQARESELMTHPMIDSFSRRGKGSKGFNKKGFPELKEGMPGTGEEFEDGMAGGLPFDAALPACPFYGKNLEEFFKDE